MSGEWLSNWLSSLSSPLIGIASFALMLIAAAGGQLLHRRQAKRDDQESEPSIAQEGYLFAGILGLLGLMLAFTFGMALNRYEARRLLVTQEANAIGTAYLRSQLLDEPHRGALSELLVDYTKNRIRLATNDVRGGPALARNDRLLTEIWAAVKGARQSAAAHGLTTTLLTAYNELIDLDTQRKLAWELRIPVEVLFLVIIYLSVTAAVAGHQVDGPRGKRAALVMFLLVALSVAVIADLNRPMSGHSRESQQAMVMLLASLKAQPPPVFDRSPTQP